jgi:rod shape determining protein RodA
VFDYLGRHLDRGLTAALLTLAAVGLVTLYSASGSNLELVLRHALRLAAGLVLLVALAQLRPETLARWSPVVFAVGLALLVAVLFVGTTSKGAQRWLHLGITRLQPSEIMKLCLPMMLAWYLGRGSLPPRLHRLAAALAIIALPAALVARQPDLGTAVLLGGSGLLLLFLAGLGWRAALILAGSAAAALPLLWALLHDYQRQRILTLLDPASDPLGRGYHTIQSMIAVGSGGFFGKGWLNSSQAHLEYLPESSTDFVFAVFAEEFGLIGITLLFALYLYLTGRGLLIALFAQDSYTRLLAGTVVFGFFLSFFVNIAMVTGMLPVVGVPLPLMSYGGTSVVTTLAGFGILMSIHTHRKIASH